MRVWKVLEVCMTDLLPQQAFFFDSFYGKIEHKNRKYQYACVTKFTKNL